MYDTQKFENYENEKAEERAREFHNKRTAFLILNGEVKFLKNSGMSHFEWAKTLGVDEENFNQLVRGYHLGDLIVFYKGNFTYDDAVISTAQTFATEIKNQCCPNQVCKVYCGVKVGQVEVWPPDLFIKEV